MLILQALINGLLLGGVFAAFSAGLSLIFGVMGVLNIAHGELLMLGAFTAFYLFHHWGLDPFWSLPLCFGLMYLLGYGLQRLLINRVMGQPPVTSYLLTFGLHLMLANAALWLFSADPRGINTWYATGAWRWAGLNLPYAQAATFCAALVMIGGLHQFLGRTRAGRAMRATAQDRDLARLAGIEVKKVYAATFGLGAGLTAAAGGLLATFRPIEPLMGLNYTVLAFCVVVVGGMGHLPGALWGGLVLGVVGSVSAVLFSPGWSLAVTFGLLYLALILRPAGLTGRGVVE